MSTLLQLLLRLPPSLRSQCLFPRIIEDKTPLQHFLQRAFATTRTVARAKPPQKPPAPKKTTLHPKSNAKHPPPNTRPPPPINPPTTKLPSSIPITLRPLFRETDSLLLYRAPPHRAFFLFSYLSGAGLLVGAVVVMLNVRDAYRGKYQRRMPWYFISFVASSGIMLAGFATALILAPSKVVRTISLLSRSGVTGEMDPVLRFDMRHPNPFRRASAGGRIEVPLRSVMMDRDITNDPNFAYYNIPLSEAEAFTNSHESSGVDGDRKEKRTLVQRLQGVNQSLLNLWPALKVNTRRSFNRDGMAYVSIPGHGNWKIDLRGCEVVDHGVPLAECVPEDPEFTKGMGKFSQTIGEWWRRVMG